MNKEDFEVNENNYNNVSNNQNDMNEYNQNNPNNIYYDSNVNASNNSNMYYDPNANINNGINANVNNDQNFNINNVSHNNASNAYAQNQMYNGGDVLYEDKTFQTPEEKAKDFISSLNKTMIFLIAGVALALLIVIIGIVLYIHSVNKSYVSKIVAPDVVYMGETADITVTAEGKKNLNKTVTTFKSKNSIVAGVLEDKLTGKEVRNTIVPSQEGTAEIEINSKLGKRQMAKEIKKVVVCPAFNTDILLVENVSVVKDGEYELKIDFGDELCSQGVTYETSDDSIITIDEKGVAKGVGVGKAILTIKKGERSMSINAEVTKDPVYMTSFGVTPKKVQLVPNENMRLKVNYGPRNATNYGINFYSSAEDVVKVSSGGLVTALKEGTATITINPINASQFTEKIEVIVSKNVSKEGTEVTEMTLDKTEINLVQGDSEKIKATVTPDNAKDKTIKWITSDDKIVTVSNKGVVFAKAPGKATITATTNNNISKSATVNVSKMALPIIKASDEVPTNIWHNKPYALTFSGGENGVVYYYGKTKSALNNSGSKVTIAKDEESTYYVEACKQTCTTVCDKKNKCKKTDCKKSVCSEEVSYVSRLDVTKPKITAVTNPNTSSSDKATVQIAITDNISLVQKWCVTNVDSSASCKWTTIETKKNPSVSYTATVNGIYYAFAKDVAGNISDGYKFEITNIS